MIDKNVVTRIVDEWLEGKDYFLVDVTVTPDDKIVVEIDHAEGVWIDDCVELSRYIESKLDREEEDYELEVGSAGIGQPFKVLQQYLIHIGKEVEVLTKTGKKLEGVLKEAGEDNFTVTIERKVKPEGAKRPKLVEEDVTFAYDEIKYTKYLISIKKLWKKEGEKQMLFYSAFVWYSWFGYNVPARMTRQNRTMIRLQR